jgi:hypothetical protein
MSIIPRGKMAETLRVGEMGIGRISDVPRVRNQPITLFRPDDWVVWIVEDGRDMWTLVKDQLVSHAMIPEQTIFEVAYEDALAGLRRAHG